MVVEQNGTCFHGDLGDLMFTVAAEVLKPDSFKIPFKPDVKTTEGEFRQWLCWRC